MNFFKRQFDYTTRMHMKRRAQSIDYRFLVAVIALAVAVYLVMRLF